MTNDINHIEERFLQQVEQRPLPFQELKEMLDAAATAGHPARADTLAELLQDALTEQPDPLADELLPVLVHRAGYRTDPAFRDAAREMARQFQPGGYELTAYCGFDDGVPTAECLQRLQRLLALTVDGFCHNKSWGFGIIRDRNDFAGRLTVDFDRKPGHGIGFAFAAESFVVPSEDHPLVLRNRDPAAYEQLRREHPGELLKRVLQHYGSMNAVVLQETMIRDGMVADGDWKTFWSDARRLLKNDPAVVIPAKKNESLEFLADPNDRFNQTWLNQLARTNEPDRILAAVGERETECEAPLQPQETEVLTDRLAHVLNSGPPPQRLVETLLLADRLALPLPAELVMTAWRRCLDPNYLAAIVDGMPLRRLSDFLNAWTTVVGEEAFAAVLALMPLAPLRSLPLLIDFFAATDRQPALADRMRSCFQGREQPSADWIMCLLRTPELAERLNLVDRARLPSLAVGLLESFSGETRKMQEMPSEFLSRVNRLRPFGDAMSIDQRHELMRRLQLLTQGPKVEVARGLMAAWIKAYPELASATAAAAPVEDDDGEETVRLTSWRSWREKQRQLEILVTKDIPANSREIGIARSYGDLRENHEYKAAKEHQTILYRRQGELERDLTLVKGSDLSGLPHDRAGLATCVRLSYEDQSEETVVILGEWDNEPALNIVSCRSERAKRLTGAASGDRVTLPSADSAEQIATVLSVEPLPQAVRQWMQDDAPRTSGL